MAPAAVPIAVAEPLVPAAQKASLQFFGILSVVLPFFPTQPSEKDWIARFSRIGAGAGKPSDPGRPSPNVRAAIEAGTADAWAELARRQKKIEAKQMTPVDMFGTREHLTISYLHRMGGAVLGIYGHSKQGAMHPVCSGDVGGAGLSGSNRHRVRFAPGRLPTVSTF